MLGKTLRLLYTLEGTYTPLLYTLGGSFRPVCGTPLECMLFTPFLTVQPLSLAAKLEIISKLEIYF